MKYCTRCLYSSNHPLNITFDSEGVCSGCRIHEEKDSLNWAEQEEQLKILLSEFKSKSNSEYDCIIPVSGARDSFFIVHLIKNVYKMKPLLVTYNKQYNTELGIRNLAYLRSVFDCDLLTMTVNPDTVKKITKVSMQKMGSMYWHCIAGQTVFPVQIAVRFKIPLIIWGVHQGIDQVGMFSHTDKVEMTRKYRKEHDLMGFEAEDLVNESMHLKEEDLHSFQYPHDKEIEKVGVRGIYLNNYIRWDSKAQHEKMIELYGYETVAQERTFDNYNDVDCFHYSDLHDYVKFLKYGYGKVVDHACREIRLKRLTREEGIALVGRYFARKPVSIGQFLEWVDITELGFYYFVNKFRDPSAWRWNESGEWMMLDSVLNHINDAGVELVRLQKLDGCDFKLTKLRKEEKRGAQSGKYVLMGKGYVHS